MSFNSVNRDRSPSLDSVTSVGSTDSKDSGFGVNDVTSQVGHMNGSIVAKGSANQKPSTFFGWLKSLLFGSGNKETTNWGHVAQQHAAIADELAATSSSSSVKGHATQSLDKANLAAAAFESGDIDSAKNYAAQAKHHAYEAQTAASRPARALDQLKGLDKSKETKFGKLQAALKSVGLSPEETAGYEEVMDKGIAEFETHMEESVDPSVKERLTAMDETKAGKLLGYMKTCTKLYAKEALLGLKKGELSLEDGQQRRVLLKDLKLEGIVYDHSQRKFCLAASSVATTAKAIDEGAMKTSEGRVDLEEQALKRGDSFVEPKGTEKSTPSRQPKQNVQVRETFRPPLI